MPRIDPEQERRRLTEFYSGQLDGELEKIAGQAYDLTPIAREVLRGELARRGLTAEFVDHSGPWDEIEGRELVTVRKFRNLPEALLAQGSLKSAGIEAMLIDDNVVRLDWFWSDLMGGIKLQVDRDEAEAANQILDLPIPENLDVTGVGAYEQPRCPRCQSLDVSFKELDPASYVTVAFALPVSFHRRAWRCHSCQAEWEDDRDQSEPD